jgi:hypothetical protein
MAADPDYIDPTVLKARAKKSGGAGATAGPRPRVRRPRAAPGAVTIVAAPANFELIAPAIAESGVRVHENMAVTLS